MPGVVVTDHDLKLMLKLYNGEGTQPLQAKCPGLLVPLLVVIQMPLNDADDGSGDLEDYDGDVSVQLHGLCLLVVFSA